jgi:phospholipid/cholesterol/gamma-HCH transport system substrate-binding protein
LGRRLASGVVVLALAAGGLAFGPFASSYQVKLDFTNVDGVVKGNEVQVNGVHAGSVGSLELKDSVGVVTVDMEPKFAPLHQGTKAMVRAIGLLGNKYLEIFPGPSNGPELKSGTELTIDSTTSPTDLDQINAIFDAPTREKLKTLTLQGEIALGGRAQTLNTDLRQLRNLAVAAEPLTGVIDTHQVALDRATIAFDTLTQGLVREDAALAGLLVHGDNTLTNLDATFSGNENNFANFLARGPSGLKSTDYALNAAIPVAGGAKPILPPLIELLKNMQDASVGRDGPGNPADPNSGTQYNLRVLPAICPTIQLPSC